MRRPDYKVGLLSDLARGGWKATPDQVQELTVQYKKTQDACMYFEGLVYSLTHERDKLKAENEFMCKLFNIKMENQI